MSEPPTVDHPIFSSDDLEVDTANRPGAIFQRTIALLQEAIDGLDPTSPNYSIRLFSLTKVLEEVNTVASLVSTGRTLG
jgi:hypothetical protein